MLTLRNTKGRQQGFTFTELLVALAINSILFAALITIFLTNLDHYRRVVNSNRLNQELQTSMLIMETEIRRAGYWSQAKTDIGLDQNTNPFMATGIDVTVNNNNCILFSYDQNKDGVLPAISANYDDERYGFRLNGQSIQTRTPGAAFACNAAANAWENMTDPNIVKITNLSIVLTTNTITTGPGVRGLAMRSVTISITGQLASEPSVSKTLTQHIRISNDKFIP